MQSHYRFNVSIDGRHLFCTGDTCTDVQSAQQLARLLIEKFPLSEGYYIQCHYWTSTGKLKPELSNP